MSLVETAEGNLATSRVKRFAVGIALLSMFLTMSPYPIAAASMANRPTVADNAGVKGVTIINLSFNAVLDADFATLPNPALDSQLQTEAGTKQTNLGKYYLSLAGKYAQTKAMREKAQKLVKFLKSQHSPIATDAYAKQIILLADAAGVDYRVIIGIMGEESGLCAASFSYNCFGYLNGVHYSGFEASLNDIIPKVSAQYIKPYGKNFFTLLKAYGVINTANGLSRFLYYYNSL